MIAAGTGDASETADSVPHEEWLLRLNFNPEHIVDGKVVPTAVSLSDLNSRGYSIDRECIIDVEVIIERAKKQVENKPHERKAPFVSRFQCGPVCREFIIPESEPAFIVEACPVIATETQRQNPAHAHIKSAASRSQSSLRRLRLVLINHLQCLIALDEYTTNGAGTGKT